MNIENFTNHHHNHHHNHIVTNLGLISNISSSTSTSSSTASGATSSLSSNEDNGVACTSGSNSNGAAPNNSNSMIRLDKLPTNVRFELDQLELELLEGDITQKGYEKKKAKLLAPYLNDLKESKKREEDFSPLI